MTTQDSRGRISDDDPSARTSVLPSNPSGWSAPEQGSPEFAPHPPGNAGNTGNTGNAGNTGNTQRLDFSGSEIVTPPRTGGTWSRGQKLAVGLALVAMALGGG